MAGDKSFSHLSTFIEQNPRVHLSEDDVLSAYAPRNQLHILVISLFPFSTKIVILSYTVLLIT